MARNGKLEYIIGFDFYPEHVARSFDLAPGEAIFLTRKIIKETIRQINFLPFRKSKL